MVTGMCHRPCGLARMSELLALISDRRMSLTSHSRAEPFACPRKNVDKTSDAS